LRQMGYELSHHFRKIQQMFPCRALNISTWIFPKQF